jgi:hypothetical protein
MVLSSSLSSLDNAADGTGDPDAGVAGQPGAGCGEEYTS